MIKKAQPQTITPRIRFPKLRGPYTSNFTPTPSFRAFNNPQVSTPQGRAVAQNRIAARNAQNIRKIKQPVISTAQGIAMDPAQFAKNVGTGIHYGLVDYGSKLRDGIYATGMYSGLGLKLINDIINGNIHGTNTITYDSNGNPIIKDGYKSNASRTINKYLDSFIKGTLDSSSYWNKLSQNYLQNIQKQNPTFSPTEGSKRATTAAAGLTEAILGGKGVGAITPKAIKPLVHLNSGVTAITNGPAMVNGVGTATSTGQSIAMPRVSKDVARAIEQNPALRYVLPVPYFASQGLKKGRDGLNPIIRNWLPVFGRLAADPFALQNSKWFKPDVQRATSGQLPTKFNINTQNGTANVAFNTQPNGDKVYITGKPGQTDARIGLGPRSIYNLATEIQNQPGAIPIVFDYTNPNETFVYQKFPMNLLHQYNDTRADRINANSRLITALLKK